MTASAMTKRFHLHVCGQGRACGGHVPRGPYRSHGATPTGRPRVRPGPGRGRRPRQVLKARSARPASASGRGPVRVNAEMVCARKLTGRSRIGGLMNGGHRTRPGRPERVRPFVGRQGAALDAATRGRRGAASPPCSTPTRHDLLLPNAYEMWDTAAAAAAAAPATDTAHVSVSNLRRSAAAARAAQHLSGSAASGTDAVRRAAHRPTSRARHSSAAL